LMQVNAARLFAPKMKPQHTVLAAAEAFQTPG
jgi:hypothetical protein